MALDAATVQEMLRKLADDQATYIKTLTSTQELLSQALIATAGGKPSPLRLTSETIRRATDDTFVKLDVESVKKDSKGSTISVADDTDTEDDESLFVQHELPPETYDENGLKGHLQNHPWTAAGRAILSSVLDNESVLRRDTVFPKEPGPVADRSHLSHYSIFDVGQDGAPLEIPSVLSGPLSRAMDIWERVRNLNNHPSRGRKAVGRITIVREPSPLLFAALHYTMKDHFDMDEVFHLLVESDKTQAIAHRAFSDNIKHRKSFVFSMEYFTIVGDGCKPMAWQDADEELAGGEMHVPVSRCSSVVGLSLRADPIGRIRNRNRRMMREDVKRTGDVYDPFSPWHVLSLQAYPDWKSSVHSHDSTKHYVNGPEAFLVTLRAEFKDAQKRLLEVYHRISELVRTPPDFMFRSDVRDKLLFEDDEFTFSRRYFWAQQSLGIMNEDINEMITAYKQTFTDDVWHGSDKIIWPGDSTTSSRYAHWRKRMRVLREDIEDEIHGLERIDQLNDEKIKEIKNLRDNLFSGTSVLESRRSVQQQAITVQQGHNIKLLTLVTIFFLPLTFVTSIYGMTNIDPSKSFKPFGFTIIAICLPTYLLIGFLNTTSGLDYGVRMIDSFNDRIIRAFAFLLHFFGTDTNWTNDQRNRSKSQIVPASDPRPPIKPRSQSATEGLAARGGLGLESLVFTASPLSTPRRVQFEQAVDNMTSITANEPSELRSPYFIDSGAQSKAHCKWNLGFFKRREREITTPTNEKYFC